MELNKLKQKIKQIILDENDRLERSGPWDGKYDQMTERIVDVLQEEISKRS